MSRTYRIYNKRPIMGGPGFQGWISSNRYTCEDLRYLSKDWAYWCGPWIGYDPHRQFSRMRGWKDRRFRSRRRQAWKVDLLRESQEYIGFADSDIDWIKWYYS